MLTLRITKHQTHALYRSITPMRKYNSIALPRGNIAWTLEQFLTRARQIHGNKFDYTHITKDNIKNKKSKISIICKICRYLHNPTIDSHIHSKGQCPKCSGKIPWTLENFLSKAKEIHSDKYNYDEITNKDIQGRKSKIPVICKICSNKWAPRICDHITGKTGCPKCIKSRGEIACAKILDSYNINYICEFVLNNLPRKRFDFKFEYGQRKYLLEFDGMQHFKFSPRFHANNDDFEMKRQIDILKTKEGIESDYCIIRIDYTQIHNIDRHIKIALNNPEILYFSDRIMYKYIIDALIAQ